MKKSAISPTGLWHNLYADRYTMREKEERGWLVGWFVGLVGSTVRLHLFFSLAFCYGFEHGDDIVISCRWTQHKTVTNLVGAETLVAICVRQTVIGLFIHSCYGRLHANRVLNERKYLPSSRRLQQLAGAAKQLKLPKANS